MEEIQNNPINTPVQTTVQEPPKKNNEHITIIIISILFTLIGIGLGILYMIHKNTCQPINCPETECNIDCKKECESIIANNEKETVNKTIEDNEETEITDNTLLRDLKNKLLYIFDIGVSWDYQKYNKKYYITPDNMEPLITIEPSWYDQDLTLFLNGGLTESDKLRTVIDHLDLRPLNETEINDAIRQSFYSYSDEYVANQFRNKFAVGIDGNTVVKKYKEIWGQDVIKGQISSGRLSAYYEYNIKNDFYYPLMLDRGHSATYKERYYYINRYTKSNSHAYVYVSTGMQNIRIDTMMNPIEGLIYCDIADYRNDDSECMRLTDRDQIIDFEINEDNYKKFAEYRIVFDKSADGNYYFSKVEKVTN